MIDIEKIDPYNEEDWNEKDEILISYKYSFDDYKRIINVEEDLSTILNYNSIQTLESDVEFDKVCKEKNDSTIKGKIVEYLKNDNRNKIRTLNMFKSIYGTLKAEANWFRFSLKFANTKNRNYFLNPFKRYTIHINKRTLDIIVDSKYKNRYNKNRYNKNPYYLNNGDVSITLIFNYRDTKISLSKLNNIFDSYITSQINVYSSKITVIDERKTYEIIIK